MISERGIAVGQKDTIVLIHGTFANNAEWISPESQLATALVGRFPGIRIDTFRWSGDNAHSARIAAGEALARRIDHLSSDLPPGAAIHLVGHSHGGNVALYALDRSHNAGKVKSVACLGTPFLHIEANNIESGLRFWTNVTRLVAALFLGMFFIASIISLHVLEGSTEALVIIFGCMVVASSFMDDDGLGTKFAKKLSSRLQTRIVSEGEAFANRISQNVPKQRVFIAFTRGDEARMLLKFGSHAGSLSAQVFSIIQAIFWPVVGTSLACHVSLGLISEHLPLRVADPDSLAAMQDPLGAISLLINTIWIIFLLPVAILLGNLIFRSNPLIFGWEHPWSAMACRLRPQAVPDWAADVKAFLYRTDATEMGGLRHSTFYEDPSTIGALAAWLSGEKLPNSDALDPNKIPALFSQKRRLVWVAVIGTLIYVIVNLAINVRLA